MADESEWDLETSTTQRASNGSNVGLAVALAALAALGAGIAIQQLLERRLSKPEMARLKFYRYLRERGHLES
jgi:F0F1-type ATP synthase membrane subunit c/vacuolar-type H+-ATPase subunit K